MTDPELFCRIGESLYRGNWKGQLARDLGVRQSSVQQFANGRYRIKPGIWERLAGIIEGRHSELAEWLDVVWSKAEEGEQNANQTQAQDCAAEAGRGAG